MSIYQSIQDFIYLAIKNGTIESIDEIYWRNKLLQFLGLNDWQTVNEEGKEQDSLQLMDQLLSFAKKNMTFMILLTKKPWNLH